MSNSQTSPGPTFKTYRHERIYETHTELLEIATADVKSGDRILEGPAWSSHGTKGATWELVENIDDPAFDLADLTDYHGPTVTVARPTRTIAR